MRTWLSKGPVFVLLDAGGCARVILAGIGLLYNPRKPVMLTNRLLPTKLLASSGDEEVPGMASSFAQDCPPKKQDYPRQAEMSPSLRGKDGCRLTFLSECSS
jgi:hypothetical protein